MLTVTVILIYPRKPNLDYLPFRDLQSQSGNSLLQETLPLPEFFHHHTHELTFLLLGQSHGPLTIKSQLREEGKRGSALIILNIRLTLCVTCTYTNQNSTLNYHVNFQLYGIVYISENHFITATFSTYTINRT